MRIASLRAFILFLSLLPALSAATETTNPDTEPIIRLVKDIAGVFNPNAPVDAGADMGVVNERVKQLSALAGKAFDTAIAGVRANKKIEDGMDALPNAKREKAEREATMLRKNAVRILYLAHIALREVATRGRQFGADPGAAEALFRSTLSVYHDDLATWLNEWADEPELQCWLSVMAGEGVRLGMTGYDADDVERGFLEVIDLPLDLFPDAAVKDQVSQAQLRAWSNLLRWRLELGTKQALERGAELVALFKDRCATDPAYRVNTIAADGDRGYVMGEITITAARLHLARGERSQAEVMLSAVMRSKNRHAKNAQLWLADAVSDIANDWNAQPLAQEPNLALDVALMHLRRAGKVDARDVRDEYLAAAVALRNGLLALSSEDSKDDFIEQAPPLYLRYSATLAKLKLGPQAAVVALEGLRLTSARISGKDNKGNPWQNEDGAWSKSGQQLRDLASNALIYAAAYDRGCSRSSTPSLHERAVALTKKIDASLVDAVSEWLEAERLRKAGNFREAISAYRQLSAENPKQLVRAYDQEMRTWLEWIAALQAKRDDRQAASVVAEFEQYLGTSPASSELAPARLMANIDLWMLTGRHRLVLERLGADFWSKPPADLERGAQLINRLCQSICEVQRTELAGAPNAQTLTSSAARLDGCAALFAVQAQQYRNATTSLSPARAALVKSAKQQLAVAEQLGDEAAITSAKRVIAHNVVLPDNAPLAQLAALAGMKWDSGDQSGAAELYERYRKAVTADALVAAYSADPAGTVKRFRDTLVARQNFQKIWDGRGGIGDRLVDPVGWLRDVYRTTPSEQLTEDKRDFFAALKKVTALERAIAAEPIGDEAKRALMADCERLRGLCRALDDALTADTRLALHWRSTGQAARAAAIYATLYNDYDPLDDDFACGYVSGIVASLQSDAPADRAAVVEAQGIAVEILRRVEPDIARRDLFWQAHLQHLELSAHLGQRELVTTRLRNALLMSTPADDLIMAPPAGSDRRARIPRDARAVELAEHFLRLYSAYVTKAQPPYRIDLLAGADGSPFPIFTAPDAPLFKTRIEERDGHALVLVETATAGDGH
jgi:hypothetical protein